MSKNGLQFPTEGAFCFLIDKIFLTFALFEFGFRCSAVKKYFATESYVGQATERSEASAEHEEFKSDIFLLFGAQEHTGVC